jgi:hypothetical protein
MILGASRQTSAYVRHSRQRCFKAAYSHHNNNDSNEKNLEAFLPHIELSPDYCGISLHVFDD